jgi:hypothetical protein
MGTTYNIMPIPPLEEATTRVPASIVTFGLEVRTLTPKIVNEFYANRADRSAVEEAIEKMGPPDDGGLSIHVFGTDDGLEYLRFDCFDDGPHYHYVHPREEFQVVHEIDRVALGHPFPWAVGRLRTRLAEMLVEAGGEQLATHLDVAAVNSALDEVERLAARVGEPTGAKS